MELSFTGDDLPEERHQGLATGLRCVAPELLFKGIDVLDRPIFLVHQGAVGAAEDFLPAQAIQHQDDDALCFLFLRGGGFGYWRCYRRRGGGEQKCGCDEGLTGEDHAWMLQTRISAALSAGIKQYALNATLGIRTLFASALLHPRDRSTSRYQQCHHGCGHPWW